MTEEGRNGTLAEQGHELAHNMAEVFDISSQSWQTFLTAQIQEGAPKQLDPLNTWPSSAGAGFDPSQCQKTSVFIVWWLSAVNTRFSGVRP